MDTVATRHLRYCFSLGFACVEVYNTRVIVRGWSCQGIGVEMSQVSDGTFLVVIRSLNQELENRVDYRRSL